ncbi:copper chaperone PCu(A)C [Cellvibrio sp.]|uniref:copper chaperone PCu(A)C n=1 Tax=Cellvibrio sp. TaxID=1965322 RepID=UPI003964756B
MGNLIKNIALLLTFFIGTSSAFAATTSVSDFSVSNAFFYVPLGTSKTTMAFFTITNNTNSDVRITGVKSSSANQIVVMPEPVLLVPAHQSVALKSSGRYLQINGLKGKLSTGDELHLIVSLSNGRSIDVIALAKSAYDQMHGH